MAARWWGSTLSGRRRPRTWAATTAMCGTRGGFGERRRHTRAPRGLCTPALAVRPARHDVVGRGRPTMAGFLAGSSSEIQTEPPDRRRHVRRRVSLQGAQQLCGLSATARCRDTSAVNNTPPRLRLHERTHAGLLPWQRRARAQAHGVATVWQQRMAAGGRRGALRGEGGRVVGVADQSVQNGFGGGVAVGHKWDRPHTPRMAADRSAS